jgi:hypothetical protein
MHGVSIHYNHAVASPRNPFRWPDSWTDPALLQLLKDTPVTGVLAKDGPAAKAARDAGLEVLAPTTPLVKGRWPGIRTARRSGGGARVEAGPTGAPWVDSNGFLILLERAASPGRQVWIDADPPREGVREKDYLTAIADSAAYGGRWVLSLDPALAGAMASKAPAAMATWSRMMSAVRFFDRHEAWSSYRTHGLLAVVADFNGPGRFLNREVLNLTARLHQPYRIIDRAQLTAASLAGLKAVVAPDRSAPSAEARSILTKFAEDGGLLIVAPSWGPAPADAGPDPHPRYAVGPLGKGRLAVARAPQTDPYLVANDAMNLLGHREDLVRFWNAGSMGSHYTLKPGGGALVQIVNYASRTERYPVSFRVEGAYRKATLWSFEKEGPQPLEALPDRGGVELHLPVLPVYAAVELA